VPELTSIQWIIRFREKRVKKITDEQILGEKGVNLIQSIVLQMGFTWHPSNQPLEAGIDGWVELRDSTTGEVANFWLAVQSRARSQLREDDTSVKYTCTLKDAEYWMQGNPTQPVILVVSKPEEGLAWWVSVRDYLRDKNIKRDRLVVFDKRRNLLTPATAGDWKALGTAQGIGNYFAPTQRTERLTSNLLQVNRFAETVYSAVTPATSGKELAIMLREVEEWPPREWYFGAGPCIYSFHDLKSSPWTQVCDTSTIDAIPTERIAFSDAEDDRLGFVRLLNGCFRTIVGRHRMRYSKEQDCYYFAPNRADVVRSVGYRSRKKKTSREVVSRHMNKKDKTRIAYYRHDALEHRFLRFGDTWYLMIEPTYVFTSDGKQPDPYREEHLSKIKSIEGDAAVSGKVVMFNELFRDHDSLYDDPYPFIGFGKTEWIELNVGIDDEAWTRLKQAASSDEQDEDPLSDFGAGLFD